jgi:hypothetical protein
VYVEEMKTIAELARQVLSRRGFFDENTQLAKYETGSLPLFSFRINIPKIPTQDVGNNLARLPSFLQANRKQLHLEIARADHEMWEAVIDTAKVEGYFKIMWGKHCHVTAALTWESPHGDLKRCGKFQRKSTNFNASMGGTDIHGFLDLNDTICVYKSDGSFICEFSGREVLCSFFKFKDGTPFIAAVHQQSPLSMVHVVHPNIPEGEVLATSLQKQPAAFIKGHLSDLQVDDNFIQRFLDTFVDPQLIHDIHNCKWDSETQTLLTQDEQEQDTKVINLEEQTWWKDVVKQYEQVKEKEKKHKNYAAQEALFDLDGEMSTKTMHEKNDKKQQAAEEVVVEDSSSDDESEQGSWTEVRRGKRKGSTPNASVEVQSDKDESDGEQSGADDSSDNDSSTASAGDHSSNQAGNTG